MYDAMASAPLGDDVLGDEPTVQKLEELAADKMGKESSVFVPSGTMANQIALATHTNRGDSVLIEDQAHMLFYEAAGPAVIAGVLPRSMYAKEGVVPPDEIRARCLHHDEHTPGTTLVCFENTHNRHGGAVTDVEHHRNYREICDELGLKIHLDGARVFNASVALGVDVREITKHVDTVSFCLSKGLSSPVGSLLCGSKDFIAEARLWRKRLGGGMRQAGILAACGIVSLNAMVDRLAEDHARCARLHDGCAEVDGLKPRPSMTNILIVDTAALAGDWQDRLNHEGVLCFSAGVNSLRFVTHRGVDDDGISFALETIERLAGDFC